MRSTAGGGNGRTRKSVVGLISVLGVAACLWGSAFVYLFALGDEGSVPPKSRIPAIPAGASVVAEGKECASGGCWWQVTVKPAAGQSPQDLAAAMGLTDEQKRSPTLFDPGSVYVGAEPRDDTLVIHVGYQ